MKILLIHYRYYVEGGPERYLFNIKQLLETKDHEVIPFSINYPNSKFTEYIKYFPEPIVSDFHLSVSKISLLKKIKLVFNYIYNGDAKRKLKQLIKDTNPDIAYVLIYSGKLTYSVLDACKEMNIPVVHRISEFYHYCAKSSFFRDGKVCTECLKEPKSCIKYSCVHNSKSKSILSYIAEEKEKKSNIRKYISAIICPSEFTKKIYEDNNIYPSAKIYHVPTFFYFSNTKQPSKEKILERKRTQNICYIGRICQEKGIDTIINAWRILEEKGIDATLHLTGFFNDSYCKMIKNKIESFKLKKIKTYDFLPKEETFKIIDASCISLIPSIWYDNMPNSFIESQAYGIPVIATDIGSLSELIIEGNNGYKFDINNYEILFQKIISMLNMDEQQYVQLALNSFNFIYDYCSNEKHYKKLISIFENVIGMRGTRLQHEKWQPQEN